MRTTELRPVGKAEFRSQSAHGRPGGASAGLVEACRAVLGNQKSSTSRCIAWQPHIPNAGDAGRLPAQQIPTSVTQRTTPVRTMRESMILACISHQRA